LSEDAVAGAGDRGYNKFFMCATGTSKDRPEHSDQHAYRQHRDKDEVPQACALPKGKIDMWICVASKNQAETVGMVIKNQNAAYFLGCGIS